MRPDQAATHTILVDDQVFEVLARTAETRGTDINGVLKHLLETPAVTATPTQDHEE